MEQQSKQPLGRKKPQNTKKQKEKKITTKQNPQKKTKF